MIQHIYLESDVTVWDALVAGRMTLPRPSEQCTPFLSLRPRNLNHTDFTTRPARPARLRSSVGGTGLVFEEPIVVHRAALR